jgi:outer membrane protein TolC
MKKYALILCILLSFAKAIEAQTDLNYFINAAKQNSPLILDNKNQSKANQLEAQRLKAFYTKPQIGITANYLFSPIINLDNNTTKFEPNSSGADKYVGYDFAASNGGTYQALLNVTQPLFNSERYKTYADQLNVTTKINENNVKLTEHDIEKIITDQYILCLQDSKQADYAETMMKLLEEQKVVIQKLVENSIYKQSDLILFNIEYQNFIGQTTAFKANYRRDLMDLNVLCGINDTTLVKLNVVDLPVNGNVTESLFAEKYRLDSMNLISAQKSFELKYKPQLNAFANTGLNAVYAPTIPNRFGLSGGISFTYNLFDGGQKNITRNKTDLLLKSVSSYRENFNKQNSVRKTKILNELQSYTSRISIAENQLKEYQSLLNSYKKEIVSGQLSVINYITTLKNMALLQRDYSLLFSQKQSLINAYNYWNW